MGDTKPQLTVISLGWGVQSWTLAAMVALGELPPVDYVVHADTTWERERTYAFAERWTPWLLERGVNVVTVRDGEQAQRATTAESDAPFFTPREEGRVTGAHDGSVIQEYERVAAVALPAVYAGSATAATREIVAPLEESGNVFAPVFTGANTAGDIQRVTGNVDGQLRRQCTERWKIAPQRRFITEELGRRGLKKTPGVVEKWLGISLDEWQRAKTSDVQYETHRYPLLERRMTRSDCILWLQERGLEVPAKSSCVFCPYHNRRAWEELKREGGRDWEIAVMVDEAIRDKRPPYPLYVHTSRKPLREAVIIPEDIGVKQSSLFDRPEDEDETTCDSGHCFL